LCQPEWQVSYGYASSPGKRASMEDFYDAKIDSVDRQIVDLFGVFDGKGFLLAIGDSFLFVACWSISFSFIACSF
jgi:serine/threonine protein phosphatase PrpC